MKRQECGLNKDDWQDVPVGERYGKIYWVRVPADVQPFTSEEEAKARLKVKYES
jgi:hypothetical protein